MDVCSNSYSTKYQGTYSEKYICNEEGTAINTTIYWGHDCIGQNDKPAFTTKVLDYETTTYCYNETWDWDTWNYWYGDYNYNYNTTTTTTTTTTTSPIDVDIQNVTITPTGFDDDTFIVTYCYNTSYVGYLQFNCDKSLPICPHTNYTYLEPLPEERECEKDKSKANWETEIEVVNQCLCYDQNYYYDWDTGDFQWLDENATFCSNYLCDEDGIWYVEYDFVNTSRPKNEWCASTMDYVNETDGTVYEYIPSGCDRDLGQWMVMEYCPDDDSKANMSQYLIALILSLICCNYFN